MLRDKYIKEDGIEIPYIWNVNSGHKMVLLCLHGFTGSKESVVIAALMEALGEKGIGVVTFDWPAHGESNAPDDNLIVENCLADLEIMLSLIKKRTDLPLSCFATSFGGYLATLYRNTHPDIFRYLILRSPALKMSDVSRGLITEEVFSKLNGEKVLVGFERKLSIGKDFYDSLCRNDAFTPAPPHPENMMIIQGGKDTVVNPMDTLEYAEKNHITLNLFEGAGHNYINPSEKERIIEVTEDFLLPRL